LKARLSFREGIRLDELLSGSGHSDSLGDKTVGASGTDQQAEFVKCFTSLQAFRSNRG
jgi:hypothetical protein